MKKWHFKKALQISKTLRKIEVPGCGSRHILQSKARRLWDKINRCERLGSADSVNRQASRKLRGSLPPPHLAGRSAWPRFHNFRTRRSGDRRMSRKVVRRIYKLQRCEGSVGFNLLVLALNSWYMSGLFGFPSSCGGIRTWVIKAF